MADPNMLNEEHGLPQGWGCPANSRKAHYFVADDMRSLCGKWAYTGERFDDKHDHSLNCADCKRRRAKLCAGESPR